MLFRDGRTADSDFAVFSADESLTGSIPVFAAREGSFPALSCWEVICSGISVSAFSSLAAAGTAAAGASAAETACAGAAACAEAAGSGKASRQAARD